MSLQKQNPHDEGDLESYRSFGSSGAFFEAGARGRWSGASSPSSPAGSPDPPPLSPLMSVSVPRNRRGSIFSFEEEDQPSTQEVPIGMTSPVAAALAAGKPIPPSPGRSHHPPGSTGASEQGDDPATGDGGAGARGGGGGGGGGGGKGEGGRESVFGLGAEGPKARMCLMKKADKRTESGRRDVVEVFSRMTLFKGLPTSLLSLIERSSELESIQVEQDGDLGAKPIMEEGDAVDDESCLCVVMSGTVIAYHGKTDDKGSAPVESFIRKAFKNAPTTTSASLQGTHAANRKSEADANKDDDDYSQGDYGRIAAMIPRGNAFGEESVLRHSPYQSPEEAAQVNAPCSEGNSSRRHTILPSGGGGVEILRICGRDVLSSLYHHMPGEMYFCKGLIYESLGKEQQLRRPRDLRSIAIALETGGAFHRIVGYSAIEALSRRAELLSVSAGESVYEEGQKNEPGSAYIIIRGRVGLYSSDVEEAMGLEDSKHKGGPDACDDASPATSSAPRGADGILEQGSGSGKLGSSQNLLVRGGSKGEIGKSQISAVDESSSSPVLKSRDSGGCEAPSPLGRPEGSEHGASGLFGQESSRGVDEAEMDADLQVAVVERSDIFGTADESTSRTGYDHKNDDQQKKRLFSARALTDCELIVVPSDDLQSAMAAGNLVLNGRLWLSLLSQPTPRKASSLLIAQLLNSYPLFSPLAYKHRVEFSKTVQMLTLEKGDLVYVQGENSQTAEHGVCGFLVVTGLVSVHAFGDAKHVDKERYLEHSKSQGLIETCFGARVRNARAGGLIGERSITTGKNSKRTTTCVCTSRVDLLVVRAQDYSQGLDVMTPSRVKEILREGNPIELDAVAKHFGKTIPLFGGLPRSVITSLIPDFTVIDVPKGCAAVKQGETCDKFYIVLSGCFSCFVIPQHGQHHHHNHHHVPSSPSPHPVQHAQDNTASTMKFQPSKPTGFSQVAVQAGISSGILFGKSGVKGKLQRANMRLHSRGEMTVTLTAGSCVGEASLYSISATMGMTVRANDEASSMLVIGTERLREHVKLLGRSSGSGMADRMIKVMSLEPNLRSCDQLVEVIRLIEGSQALRGTTVQQIGNLSKVSTLRSVPKGHVISDQATDFDSLNFIVSGHVAICKELEPQPSKERFDALSAEYELDEAHTSDIKALGGFVQVLGNMKCIEGEEAHIPPSMTGRASRPNHPSIFDQSKQRRSSAYALTPCQIVSISKANFDHCQSELRRTEIQQAHDLLVRLSPFDSWKQKELHNLCSLSSRKAMGRGTPLFEVGDAADSVYFLLTGECKIYRSATTFTVTAGEGGAVTPGGAGKKPTGPSATGTGASGGGGAGGAVGVGGKVMFPMRTVRGLSILGLDTVQAERGEGLRHKWTCVIESDADVLVLKRSDVDSVGVKNVSLRQLAQHYARSSQLVRETAANSVSALLQKALFPGGEVVSIHGVSRLVERKKKENELKATVEGKVRLGVAMSDAASGANKAQELATPQQVVLALLRLRAHLRKKHGTIDSALRTLKTTYRSKGDGGMPQKEFDLLVKSAASGITSTALSKAVGFRSDSTVDLDTFAELLRSEDAIKRTVDRIQFGSIGNPGDTAARDGSEVERYMSVVGGFGSSALTVSGYKRPKSASVQHLSGNASPGISTPDGSRMVTSEVMTASFGSVLDGFFAGENVTLNEALGGEDEAQNMSLVRPAMVRDPLKISALVEGEGGEGGEGEGGGEGGERGGGGGGGDGGMKKGEIGDLDRREYSQLSLVYEVAGEGTVSGEHSRESVGGSAARDSSSQDVHAGYPSGDTQNTPGGVIDGHAGTGVKTLGVWIPNAQRPQDLGGDFISDGVLEGDRARPTHGGDFISDGVWEGDARHREPPHRSRVGQRGAVSGEGELPMKPQTREGVRGGVGGGGGGGGGFLIDSKRDTCDAAWNVAGAANFTFPDLPSGPLEGRRGLEGSRPGSASSPIKSSPSKRPQSALASPPKRPTSAMPYSHARQSNNNNNNNNNNNSGTGGGKFGRSSSNIGGGIHSMAGQPPVSETRTMSALEAFLETSNQHDDDSQILNPSSSTGQRKARPVSASAGASGVVGGGVGGVMPFHTPTTTDTRWPIRPPPPNSFSPSPSPSPSKFQSHNGSGSNAKLGSSANKIETQFKSGHAQETAVASFTPAGSRSNRPASAMDLRDLRSGGGGNNRPASAMAGMLHAVSLPYSIGYDSLSNSVGAVDQEGIRPGSALERSLFEVPRLPADLDDYFPVPDDASHLPSRPASAMTERKVRGRRMDLGVIYKRGKGAKPQQNAAFQAAAPLAKAAGIGAWGNREKAGLWVPACIMGSKIRSTPNPFQ